MVEQILILNDHGGTSSLIYVSTKLYHLAKPQNLMPMKLNETTNMPKTGIFYSYVNQMLYVSQLNSNHVLFSDYRCGPFFCFLR